MNSFSAWPTRALGKTIRRLISARSVSRILTPPPVQHEYDPLVLLHPFALSQVFLHMGSHMEHL